MGLADIFEKFDPLHPLTADEGDLYVDWQARIGADDVKPRLANAIALSRNRAAGVLFTGHRGTGKTTELRRVAKSLEDGVAGRKHLVCHVEAEEWNDAALTSEEIVLQIAIALAERLKDEGFDAPFEQTGTFLRRVIDKIRDNVAIDGATVEAGVPEIVKLTVSLKQSSTTRDPLRAALKSESQSLTTLVNDQILLPAKAWLRERNIGDIVVVVDQLDRMPRAVDSGGAVNHERLFIDESGPLRNLACDLLYVIPIELAYSTARGRLQDVWGTAIVGLPVPPVQSRNPDDRREAVDCLREIVRLRANAAGYELTDLFEPGVLERLITMSGGHPRTMFIMLRGLVLRHDEVRQYSDDDLDKVIKASARDMDRGLRTEYWSIIDLVNADNERHDDAAHGAAWYELLQNFYVLHYEDADGDWYDSHPLLGEVKRS